MTSPANPMYAAPAYGMRWRPQQAERVPDPRLCSAEPGAQVAQPVDRLSMDLAGPEPVGEC